MIKIQVVGLPGAGKTQGIKKFLKSRGASAPLYIDIRQYKNSYKEYSFKKAITESSYSLIAESACGVPLKDTINIKLEIPREQLYNQLKTRDQVLDTDYLSLLERQMIHTHYTIHSCDQLVTLLDYIYRGSLHE